MNGTTLRPLAKLVSLRRLVWVLDSRFFLSVDARVQLMASHVTPIPRSSASMFGYARAPFTLGSAPPGRGAQTGAAGSSVRLSANSLGAPSALLASPLIRGRKPAQRWGGFGAPPPSLLPLTEASPSQRFLAGGATCEQVLRRFPLQYWSAS